MRQCVIWGAGDEYENILNHIRYEELKGNLKCAALLSKTTSQFAKKRDGYPLIGKDGLKEMEFDYLIIAVEKAYQEVLEEALSSGIPRGKIISSRVFKIPNFDFKRYASLRENPVTILSDDCWGGRVYRYLDLPFTSPLINIRWPSDSYCEFIKDPLFYLEQPLYIENEADPRNGLYPIGRLGDHDRSVKLYFVHEANPSKAENNWNRRKKRINKNRIFIKFNLSTTNLRREEYLEAFNQAPYPKACIYSGHTDLKDILYAERFEWDWFHRALPRFSDFVIWFEQCENYLKVIDLLKLLNGEKDYLRES